MRFEQFLRRIEARTDAEIGGALQDAAVWEAAGNRVDVVARSQILTHFQIGGREAQEAAVLIPMLHSPAHGEGAGEQARRGFAIARLKGFADAARWDHFLGVIDGRDHFGEEAEAARSEEHTYELQSLMRISYAVFCLKK